MSVRSFDRTTSIYLRPFVGQCSRLFMAMFIMDTRPPPPPPQNTYKFSTISAKSARSREAAYEQVSKEGRRRITHLLTASYQGKKRVGGTRMVFFLDLRGG